MDDDSCLLKSIEIVPLSNNTAQSSDVPDIKPPTAQVKRETDSLQLLTNQEQNRTVTSTDDECVQENDERDASLNVLVQSNETDISEVDVKQEEDVLCDLLSMHSNALSSILSQGACEMESIQEVYVPECKTDSSNAYDWPASLPQEKSVRPDKPYMCGVCSKMFRELSDLETHVGAHLDDTPIMPVSKLHKCDVCDKQYRWSSDLVKHKLIHLTPYRCSVCERTFDRLDHFNTHKHVHSCENVYACPYCDLAFCQYSSLLLHKRLHFREQPYNSGVWQRYFRQHSAPSTHRRVHFIWKKTPTSQMTSTDDGCIQGNDERDDSFSVVHSSEMDIAEAGVNQDEDVLYDLLSLHSRTSSSLLSRGASEMERVQEVDVPECKADSDTPVISKVYSLSVSTAQEDSTHCADGTCIVSEEVLGSSMLGGACELEGVQEVDVAECKTDNDAPVVSNVRNQSLSLPQQNSVRSADGTCIASKEVLGFIVLGDACEMESVQEVGVSECKTDSDTPVISKAYSSSVSLSQHDTENSAHSSDGTCTVGEEVFGSCMLSAACDVDCVQEVDVPECKMDNDTPCISNAYSLSVNTAQKDNAHSADGTCTSSEEVLRSSMLSGACELEEIQEVDIPECKTDNDATVVSNIHNQSVSLQQQSSVHPAKRYVCGVCRSMFRQLYHLKRHVRLHTGERPFVCEKCNKSYTRSSHLKRHTLVHSGEKPFVCDKCSRSFKCSDYLVIHQRTHTGEKPYTCDLCSKTFRSRSNLRTHMLIHTAVKKFACDVCHKQFRHSASLASHKRNFHSANRLHKCNVCDVVFADHASLVDHRSMHSYPCDVCKKNFRSMKCLNTHKHVVHSSEKQFVCHTCNKVFNQSSKLTAHLRVHKGDKPYTGVKPYRCHLCQKHFVQRSFLAVHMRLHSADKPFNQCNVCKKIFRYPSSLGIHTRDEPFTCGVCEANMFSDQRNNNSVLLYRQQTEQSD